MKKSKIALAIALSAGLLTGCDFDVGPENGDSSGGDGGSTPTSALVGPIWNFEDTSGASTQSTDLPNVYVFDGENQRYYTDNTSDTLLGTYVIITETYSEEDGVVTFTYYDSEGNPIKATGQYEVAEDGTITIDSDTVGVLNGADESANDQIKAAVEAANAEAGFNNLVQIQDTVSSIGEKEDPDYFKGDKGELRLKFEETLKDLGIDSIASGRVTVDLIYQNDEDTKQAADGTGDNAYLSLYASGTSNSNLHGEILLENGKIKYRDKNGDQVETGETFELGETLAVDVSWANGLFSFSINDKLIASDIPVADTTTDVTVLALKIGDDGNTTNFELLADNLVVYSIEDGLEEKVFEDNFDLYKVGQDLSGNPYNNNSHEAIVIGNTPDEPEDPIDPVDPPAPGEFTDDFESYVAGTQIDTANETYTVAGTDVNGDPMTALVSSDFANSGVNSLYLFDDSPEVGTPGEGETPPSDDYFKGAKPVVSKAFASGAAESGSVSTSVYIPTDGYVKSTYLYLGASDSASSSSRFTEIIFTSDEIKFRDNEKDQVALHEYAKDSWVDVTISWEGTAITLEVDGTSYTTYEKEVDNVLTTLPMTAENKGAAELFAVYVGDNGSEGTYSYFDNLDSDLF